MSISSLYLLLGKIPFLVRIKKSFDFLEYQEFLVRAGILRLLRQTFGIPSSYTPATFMILCVKRPEYVALAIRNINSLHFYNPTHKVKVYVDAICKKAFLSRKKDIDYPNTVECVEFFSNKNQPWQYMKIEALIEASKQSAYLVDADTRWFADPVVSDKKMTFLVFANYVDDNQMERNLITSVFHKKKWGVYGHYVSGFVSIPQRFMTLNLKQKLRAYVRKIYENTEGETRRLSEELAISYAVQSLYLKRQITTLKASDGPGDRHIMQSMYYGCSNRIIT